MHTSKYNNKVIHTSDGKFDSKKEYMIWIKLKRQQELGHIKNLHRQVPFVLIDKSKFGTEVKYIADFVYQDSQNNEIVVCDAKSSFTEKNPVFKIKSRLFAERYGFQIKILK